MLDVDGADTIDIIERPAEDKDRGNNDQSNSTPSPSRVSDGHTYDIDFWEPKPPKVLMDDPAAVPLELRLQIQLYATTESVYRVLFLSRLF
jgi:hypothetical protein